MTDSVACVIPAYQASRTLVRVAEGLRAALPGAVLVAVDDGSTDATARVARATCDHLVRLGGNRGKGAALRAGVAIGLAKGATAIITVDADGQHDPVYAPALIAALERADIAIGARARGGSEMPIGRRITNGLSAVAMTAVTGTCLVDPQSGFRALRRAVLESIEPVGDGYEYEADLLIRACRAGFRVASVRVPTIYGAESHFRVSDGLTVVRTIWRHRHGALQRTLSLAAVGQA